MDAEFRMMAIAGLKIQKERIDLLLQELQAKQTEEKPRRIISPEGRLSISRAQKLRWRKYHKDRAN